MSVEKQRDSMENLKYVTYCGLYCRLCTNLARIPQQAKMLKATMSKAGYEIFGEHYVEHFKEFWEVLGRFSETDKTCPACRGGCGDPSCKVRICAREKEIERCPVCKDYPCEHVLELAKRYPNLVADGKRQEEIGIEAWIEEQEERIRAGFCYDQIRYEV